MAKMFGKSWYRIEAKIRQLCHDCATIVPRFPNIDPVDNLNLSTTTVIVLISITSGNVCGEQPQLRDRTASLEPHFEVVRNPFQKGGYIAQMSLPGIAVSEEIPNDKMNEDDDRDDMGLFWANIRKKLLRRLREVIEPSFKIA